MPKHELPLEKPFEIPASLFSNDDLTATITKMNNRKVTLLERYCNKDTKCISRHHQ